MKRILTIAAAALALSAGAASATKPRPPQWSDYRDVSNSSYVAPDGGRVLQLSIMVKASPAQVWRAFTTGEGYREWVAPVAKIDLTVDGMIEASYDADAKIGDPENIKNQIVAYVPERMLAIRNVQAPKALAHGELFSRISTTIELEDLGQGRTRVTITGVGYGAGEGFDALYRHFEWGNAYSLNKLKERFETGPIDWAALERAPAAISADVQGGKPK